MSPLHQTSSSREFNGLIRGALSGINVARLLLRKGRAILFASVLLLEFCFPTDSHGRWQKVHTKIGFGTEGDIRTVYFLDKQGAPMVGFMGAYGLLRTTDGGLTWYSVLDDSMDANPVDFTFKDTLTGWAATDYGVIKTTDGGKTWFQDFDHKVYQGKSIFYNPANGGLFLSTWSFNFYQSWDEGNTWTVIANQDADGFAFADDNLGILSSVYLDIYPHPPGSSLLRTKDGGKNWMAILSEDSESWQPLAIKNTSIFFAIMDRSATVRRTDNAGDTWHEVYNFSLRGAQPDEYGTSSSGCIIGDTCRLFVQLRSGCYMSTDQGNNWTYLGGPPTILIFDRRCYVIGNHLFAPADDSLSLGLGESSLWMLDLDSLYPSYVGISSRFDNGSQQASVHPGDSVGITLVPGAGTLAATDSVEISLRYDPNALSTPTLTLPAGWWIADSSLTTPPPFQGGGRGVVAVLTLVLRADSAEPLPSPILQAKFKTYLSPTSGMQTFIYLDSAQSFFPQTTPCAPTSLSLQTPGSVEIDFIGCGDSTLVAAMQGTLGFTIESVVPNPARTEISVTVATEDAGAITCELYDALGNLVLRQPLDHPPASWAMLAPSYSASLHRRGSTFDVSHLPSGIYFLRLSENGYVQTSEVSIEH